MLFPELRPARRYESQPLYLGDLRSRQTWAERKPLIEITVLRDAADGSGRVRVKRRGIFNRANGETIFVGPYCYHVGEILSYREIKD